MDYLNLLKDNGFYESIQLKYNVGNNWRREHVFMFEIYHLIGYVNESLWEGLFN